MIQRSALQYLEQWKSNPEHKPLVVRGARQVGKTTLINQFSEGFDNYLYLNLDRKRDYDLFSEDDIPSLIDRIHIHCRKRKSPGKTLLFIDEIQNSPNAVRMLRYFKEEAPTLYVVAAGSLLETLIDTHISFPVGRVEYLALRPCSFVEFLNGIGEEYDAEVVSHLEADAIHERLMNSFLNYVLVGGMPEAIMKYWEHRDVLALNAIYSTLLNTYSDDVQKYAQNKTMAAAIQHILRYGWTYAAAPISFNNFAESNYRSPRNGRGVPYHRESLADRTGLPCYCRASPSRSQPAPQAQTLLVRHRSCELLCRRQKRDIQYQRHHVCLERMRGRTHCGSGAGGQKLRVRHTAQLLGPRQNRRHFRGGSCISVRKQSCPH